MADQLADPDDLATLLGVPADATMTIRVEAATAVVQEAGGNQRILEVVNDVLDTMGTPDRWLQLPQIPATAASEIMIDGSPVADWKRIGSRLWRRRGWATCYDEPSQIDGLYTHGYPADDQQLQLARSAVISLVQGAYSNPGGLASERIDDYAATYDAMSAQMSASPNLAAALRRTYGRRAGLVRIG